MTDDRTLPGRRARSTIIAALAVTVAAGCQENTFVPVPIQNVAVVAGDFDNPAEPLRRKQVAHDLIDGVGVAAVWDDEYDPELNVSEVEGLFVAEEGRPVPLLSYDALFMGSGTRGLGCPEGGVYADDKPNLLYDLEGIDLSPGRFDRCDPEAEQELPEGDGLTEIRGFVGRGRVLLLSDWTYEVLTLGWPGIVDFVGDEARIDAAQTGEKGRVRARVLEDRLVAALGLDGDDEPTLAVEFDFSRWAVPLSVVDDPRVTVWLEASVVRYVGPTGEPVEVADVPLLVTYRPGGQTSAGTVVYSAFHFSAQPDAVVDALLDTVVGNFRGASADDELESADSGDGSGGEE